MNKALKSEIEITKTDAMRKLLFYLFTCCSICISAQNGTTFKVEKLSNPEFLLPLQSTDEIYKTLIALDAGFPLNEARDHKKLSSSDIIARSQSPDSLVTFNFHPFFDGMNSAYANHRPFVLSPDMIWLLISQGFAHHVNANQEEMRNYFVDFKGKVSLVVRVDKPAESLSWEETIPQFTDQIREHSGDKLVDLLTCNFSTTTPIEKIASEITVMEAMKPYFEFIALYISCGIPEITLEGTTEDWQKVLDKATGLKKYGLDWWISELEPILKEFVQASKGKVDKTFWKNMFKEHTPKGCGAPSVIDGWIVKFFPYDKYGKRNDLKQLSGSGNLPKEIVSVDLKFIEAGIGGKTSERMLELWSGFIGLTQNKDNFTLRPQIGWMVKEKDVKKETLKSKLKLNAQQPGNSYGDGITIRVSEFPTALLELNEINRLDITFTDQIKIPDELAKVKIKILVLYGKITDEETKRIKSLFPDTDVMINRRIHFEGEE